MGARRRRTWEQGALTESCALRFAPCMPEPERLVGMGFRFWMLGLMQGEIGYWERAWCLYSEMFGAAAGRLALDDLSPWVAAVSDASERDVVVLPATCRSFCRDECLAIALVAACQHRCEMRQACARALITNAAAERVLETAQSFAETLLRLEFRLSQHTIVLGAPDTRDLRGTLH